MKKLITTKVIDYALQNERYIGARLKVITCTRNTNLNKSGIQKKGFFIEFASKLNNNRLTTVSGYSMSEMNKGSFCTMNNSGMVVPCVNGQDYADIDKEDQAFDEACSKLDFS